MLILIGGSYVTAKRNGFTSDWLVNQNIDSNYILKQYKNFFENKKIIFDIHNSVISPDDSTLFTTSGMQQYKKLFTDVLYKGTFSNVQKCLRLNDLDEIGDGTHHLVFDMLGFFSFREYTVKQTIDLMMEFCLSINIKPDYVTIHPDKINDWEEYYSEYEVEIRLDKECLWSDGNIGGYCTEFYKDDIEIGNIVNTLGTCIDVGFGLQRLEMVLGIDSRQTRLETLENASMTLINSGVEVSHYGRGYVLKKLITECVMGGSNISNLQFDKIRNNQIEIYKNYLRLSNRKSNQDKSDEYWLSTMGYNTKYEHVYKKLYEESLS